MNKEKKTKKKLSIMDIMLGGAATGDEDEQTEPSVMDDVLGGGMKYKEKNKKTSKKNKSKFLITKKTKSKANQEMSVLDKIFGEAGEYEEEYKDPSKPNRMRELLLDPLHRRKKTELAKTQLEKYSKQKGSQTENTTPKKPKRKPQHNNN